VKGKLENPISTPPPQDTDQSILTGRALTGGQRRTPGGFVIGWSTLVEASQDEGNYELSYLMFCSSEHSQFQTWCFHY